MKKNGTFKFQGNIRYVIGVSTFLQHLLWKNVPLQLLHTVELVSKELNHFGVLADLFRQIWGHSSRFVLFCSFQALAYLASASASISPFVRVIFDHKRWNPWTILCEICGHLILEECLQKYDIRIPWPSNSRRIP